MHVPGMIGSINSLMPAEFNKRTRRLTRTAIRSDSLVDNASDMQILILRLLIAPSRLKMVRGSYVRRTSHIFWIDNAMMVLHGM